ncbi:peptidoglycan DD-metalloendopeptidase family protein [Tenacibaculum amylolyticum]|uniref:peptidoglycan DD-metalloendopeptidase family protein n=1 Tax=Tenacibaculum amylolyticum TaxID=104269 RepID=UPI003892E761
MNSLIVFLLKSSAVFVLFYLVFQLLLRKHTFHQLNRIILLSIIPFSIYIASTSYIIPITTNTIEIPSFIELDLVNNDSIIEHTSPIITTENINWLLIITVIYGLGILISLFNFLKSLVKLYNLKCTSEAKRNQKYLLIYANVTEVFSCFNWIFIPKNLINTIDTIILEHEKKHIDHKHTLDLFLTELYIAFFWFNPFVYLYRKSLKSIHEYQVDSEVINSQQIDIIRYLNLLKIEIENTSNSNLYSHFRQPLIKKRIEMIMKTKSNISLKLKYLILLPIAFLCMVSFTKQHTIIPASIIPEIINENITKPSISPIKNVSKVDITAKYGPAKHPILKTMRHHNGIDFRAANGTPIVATADGVIANVSFEKNWGNLIIIKHTNGYETLYAHLSKFNCKKNQTVKKGEIIGYSGSTGLVTGPHLHYAIKHNNEYVNPIDFIN